MVEPAGSEVFHDRLHTPVWSSDWRLRVVKTSPLYLINILPETRQLDHTQARSVQHLSDNVGVGEGGGAGGEGGGAEGGEGGGVRCERVSVSADQASDFPPLPCSLQSDSSRGRATSTEQCSEATLKHGGDFLHHITDIHIYLCSRRYLELHN